jgi:flagella basal body P-ring formation protein FlgA
MFSLFVLIFSFLLTSNPSFKAELDGYLKAHLSQYKNYEYEIVRMPEDKSKIEIIKENHLNIQGNMVYVPVNVTDKSGREAKSFLTLRVKLFNKVLVAATTIERKQEISGKDITSKLVDVSQLQGTPLTSLAEISDLRSKIHIAPGTILVKEMMENIPVVKFGERVTASLVYGNVLVTTEAVVKQEGSIGDIVSIVTSNNKEFKAKVIDSQNVSIIE